MADEARLAALVDEIYVTALGDMPWTSVLEGIRQMTGARLVALGTRSASMESHVLGGASDDAQWAQETMHSYNAVFHRYDASLAIMSDWEAGRWYDDRQWHSRAHRDQSITHQEFFRPRDFSYWEGTFLHRTPDLSHMLTLVGGGEDDIDRPSYRDQIAGLQKHLARAVCMRSRFAALQAEAAHGDALLEALSEPTFLLDEQRRLLRANASAQALMAKEPGLRFVHGRFAPEGCSDQTAWTAARESGAIVIASQKTSEQPLVLTLTPVPPQARLTADWECPATLMSAPGIRSIAKTRCRLRAIYGLTTAEAEVCIQLCINGLSPQECADERRVAIGTLRSQINAILGKMGLKRLPELVRLVVGL